jgi:hypothetical protein
MTKTDKLIERFKTKPRDFTWNELTTLLRKLRFRELQGSGSRVKFYNEERNCLVQLHKPHPANILKPYMISEVLNILTESNLI